MKSEVRLNGVVDWVATIAVVMTFSGLIVFASTTQGQAGFQKAAAFTLLGLIFLFSYFAPNAANLTRCSNWICLHFFFPASRHWAVVLGVLFLTIGVWTLWGWITFA